MHIENKNVLLIVPPFASVERPSLGVHVLQSVARSNGFSVDVLYANLIFASLIGESAYTVLAWNHRMELLGDGLMGHVAFGSLVRQPDFAHINQKLAQDQAADKMPEQGLTMELISDGIAKWQEIVLDLASKAHYDYIGFSNTFEQTNACVVLIKAFRKKFPDCKILIGGGNCEGPMAEGIEQLLPEVEHIFSGESEIAFSKFLADPSAYQNKKIICSKPNSCLEDLPQNDFSEFFTQFQQWLPDSIVKSKNRLQIPYESSRGCWWGQKHHCTFCGLNGEGIGFREKSGAKVYADLRELAKIPVTRNLFLTDNIMPHAYFKTLLPQLIEAPLGLEIFYQQKANIGLKKAMQLKAAGITKIQPGIEAINTKLLTLINKGVSARQNIELMRYGMATNLAITWNFLYGFPGEEESWYAEALELIPYLQHLRPPIGIFKANIDRFSPYFTSPAAYGLENLRAHPTYSEVFPPGIDTNLLAYQFLADYPGFDLAKTETFLRLEAEINRWILSWSNDNNPQLLIIEVDENNYLLIDSRSSSNNEHVTRITRQQAYVCLVCHEQQLDETEWAMAHRTLVYLDGVYLPLAVTDENILLKFETMTPPVGASASRSPKPPKPQKAVVIPIFQD